MRSIRHWLRGLFAASSLFVGAAAAQSYDHSAYLDLDNNTATGCNVVTAAGPVNGAEVRITATVTGTPPMVTGATRAACAGGAFGAAQPIGGTYAVGLDNGLNGSDVIEMGTSLTGLGPGGAALVTFVSTSAAGADMASGLVQLPGGAPNFAVPVLVPTTGIIALLAIVGLVLILARRHPAFGSTVALLLLFGAGVVWAANFVVDGQVGDWTGVPPLATDLNDDASSGETRIEIVAVFAATEAGNLFLRVDVLEAEVPTNNAPVLGDVAFSLAENSANASAVGTATATDADAGQTLTYAITAGNAAGAFAINAATGAITVANATLLDFETTPSFTLTVSVSDNGAPVMSDTATVGINLTNVNEAPVLADATRAVAEDSAAGTPVGAPLGGTDPDAGTTLTYAITAGNTNGAFAIDNAGQLTVANAAEVATIGTFALTVTLTDEGGLSDTAAVTVNVTDQNDAPQFNGEPFAFTLPENSANATVVGSAPATDSDAGQTLAYAIAGGNTGGAFAIDAAGQITVANNAAVDFEANPTFTLSVTVTDDGGAPLSDTTSVAITVTDVNEAPVAADAAFAVAENAAPGTSVGTATAADPDIDPPNPPSPNATLTFAITAGNTGNAFAIDPATGVITTTASAPVLANSPYALTVTVTDGGALSDTATVTVTVTDQNDAPTLTDAAFSLAENSAAGSAVGTVTGTDPDAGQVLSYSITAGNGAGGFAIDANTGAITVANSAALDFETTPSFALTVTATDNGTPALSDTATVTVSLTDANDPPVANDIGFTVAENSANGTVVGTYTATDADAGQTLGYAITGGPAAALFAIDASSGQITVADSTGLDYESGVVRQLQITATDDGAGNLTDTATVLVTLGDVNEAPVATDAAFSVPENSPNGTLVGNVPASDVDAGANGTLTYAITAGNTNTAFAIDPSTGAITVATQAEIDFGASFSLTVTVTDGGALSDTATIAVSVDDVNEAPVPTATPSATPSLPENTPVGDTVATIVPNDPEAVQTHTFAIVGGNTGGAFAIDTNGVITVAVSPNFEVGPVSYVLDVQVTDNGTPALSGNVQVTVTITDVNDAPSIDSTAPASATEDAPYSYNATRSDEDGPGQTWSLLGSNTCAGASIVAATGAYTFTPAGPITPADCVLAIQVCDGGTPDLCATQTATITITPVNSAPAFTSSIPATATEDVLYTYNPTITDADGPGQAWTLGGTHTCAGTLNAGNGQFSFTPVGPTPGADCTVSLQVCDGGTPDQCATQSALVTITAVNDAPTVSTTAPTAATENAPYSYDADLADADGTGQTWALLPANTCAGASIVAGTGVYTFTPAPPNPPASCVLAIEVCDAGALCGSETATITITAINSAPTIDSTPPPAATEDTLYTYNATRSDADGPGQTWSLLGANTCAGASIVAATGAYTFTPAGPTPPADCVVAIQICDGGTPDECASQTTTIAITAVNDAPTIDSAAPATATEDTLYTYNATASDADGVSQTWSLAASNTCTGAGIVAGTGAYTYTPAGPSPLPSCNVGVQVCDNGTPNQCTTQDTTITISAVNDAPTNVVPGAQIVNEDTDLVFSAANQIAVMDGDAATMQVQLTATNGVLTTNGIAGLAFSVGDGTADATMTFTGTLADVNNALNGLIFRGTLHFFGAATLTVTSNDLGSTGSGGPLGDSDVVNITVNPVNDAPVADDETFDTLGNTELRIDLAAAATPHVAETTGTGNGVRDGDADPVEAHAFTVTSIVGCGDATAPFDCTLPSGSLVSMNANGTFTYRPSPTLPTGIVTHTPDTFNYVITDQPPGGEGAPATDTGTVTLQVFDKVWYVAAGASGNGRSDSPLGTFAGIAGAGGAGDADGPGEYIFVHHTGTTITSSIELEANQRLLGEDVGLSIPRNLNANGSPTNLVANGPSRPAITSGGNTVSIGNAIPVEIRGLALASTGGGGNAIDLSTTAATTGAATLTIAENDINGAAAEGIDVNANSPTQLTLAITGNTWNAGTHTGNAIDIANTNAGADTLRLNLSNNTGIVSAANGIMINGGAVARTTVTGFADNAVHGNTGGAGVVISNVTFDSTPGGAVQQVDGNTMLVGTSGNGTGIGGFSIAQSQGNLFFDTLDVNAATGGALVLAGTGTGLTFAVTPVTGGGTSAIDADAGPALDATSVALDLRLASLQSNTTTHGVALNTITGQFSAGDTSAIFKSSGTNVPVFSVTGSNGTVDFRGELTVTGGVSAGVSLTTNNAAHVTTLRGGMSLTTGTNPALHADGGGTLHVCDDDPCNPAATGTVVNTLVTTTGIPLNIVNTTIGGNDLEFRSITSNGASSGIVLNNTGNVGGLWVKGNGAAGTGGTIQNGASAVLLTSTRDVSLDRMIISNHADFGIRGTSVVNFAMANTTINGTNGNDAGADEGSVRFNELTGQASVTNSAISGAIEHNMQVINTSGLLDRITVTGTTFGPMNNATGSDALLIETLNTAVINATVTNNTFTHAIGDHFQFSANASTATDVVFSNNVVSNTGVTAVGGGGGLRVVGGSNVGPINAGATFDLIGNTVRDSRGTALATNKLGGNGTFSGVVELNNIGVAADAGSGSDEGSNIFFLHDNAGSNTVAVRNNTSRQYANYGIYGQAGGSGVIGSGTLNATITGNTVSNPTAFVFIKNGAHLNGANLPGDTYLTCWDFGGAGALANNVVGTGSDGGDDFRVRQRHSANVRLPGYAGGLTDTAAVVAFLQGRNTGAETGSASVSGVAGTGFVGGAACPQP